MRDCEYKATSTYQRLRSLLSTAAVTVAIFFFLAGCDLIAGNTNDSDTSSDEEQGTEDSDTQAPAEVTNLTATSGDQTAVLAWTDPFDADFAGVEITWSPNGTTVQSVDPGVESYTADGLTNDETYTFTVKTVDDAGNASSGQDVSATPASSQFQTGIAIQRASETLSDGTGGDADSQWPGIDGDGSVVVFDSAAANLVTGDTEGEEDVFVLDREAGTLERISVGTSGGGGNNISGNPVVTPDGRYVVYESRATNLVANDTNSQYDVFVYDRDTGETERVSVASDGTQANDGSFEAAVSSDGRFVAFESDATNLVANDTNGRRDVFVHDRDTGSTTRVNVDDSGNAPSSYDSDEVDISGDGNLVVFQSQSPVFAADDDNNLVDVFLRDIAAGTTIRVSVDTDETDGDGGDPDGSSTDPAISSDGSTVVFASTATDLIASDGNNDQDVFSYDVATQAIERVSVDTGGGDPNGNSAGGFRPYLDVSGDGRYVVFDSYASDLIADDTNSVWDVFVVDRQEGATQRMSEASDGTQGTNYSYRVAISDNGAYVAFSSVASNLIGDDSNNRTDVFVAPVE